MKDSKRRLLVATLASLASAAAPASALAQRTTTTATTASGSSTTRFEPSASEAVTASLRFFRVHPEALDGLRTAAHTRALLPTLTGAYHFDDWRYISSENLTGFQPHQDMSQWNQQNNSGNVEAVWELGNLAFNPDEVSVYSLVAVQRDIIVLITQTYFARRQLLLRIERSPPEDAIAREAMQLRILEFTATMDALTGGWFTRTTRTNAQRQ